MFAKNVGSGDRALRLAAGVALLVAGFVLLGGAASTLAGLATATLGAIAVITGATRRSPLYALFGVNTYSLTLVAGHLA